MDVCGRQLVLPKCIDDTNPSFGSLTSVMLDCVMAASTLATMWVLAMNFGVGAKFRPLDRTCSWGVVSYFEERFTTCRSPGFLCELCFDTNVSNFLFLPLLSRTCERVPTESASLPSPLHNGLQVETKGFTARLRGVNLYRQHLWLNVMCWWRKLCLLAEFT